MFTVDSQWVTGSKVNAYLIFQDIVKFPSIGIVCFGFSTVYESVCFLKNLPIECVVNKLLGFCQSDG